MNLGQLLILGTALATGAAVLAYLPGVARPNGTPYLRAARISLVLSALGLVAASAQLWSLFLRHDFAVDYVYRYSSRDMPLRYVISAFWGGQEGTFLLWALMGGLLALVLRFTARHLEAPVQFFYLAINLFLLLMLIKRSPFATLPVTPPDGQGLNPLLQDPWMTIHPPVVFFGFAALGIPAAYAMTALVRRDWDGWVLPAIPWTVFGILALGAGLTLGGYWAYCILGWGGFWGWDPVENSSLVPWLFSVALLHTLLIQHRQGRFRRLNLCLALLPFLFLTYSTFLTRSGVLADFSVHSFTDLGINQFLALFMILFAGGGLCLFALRFREVPEERHPSPFWSREYFLFLGSAAFALFGLLVVLGTSAPLISRLWGAPSNVGPAFYNRAGLPFAVIFAVLLGLAPFLSWGALGAGVARRLRWILPLAGVSAIALFAAGVRHVPYLLMAVSGIFALLGQTPFLLRTLRRQPRWAGAPLAHLGTGLVLIGILTSTGYSVSRTVVLPRGQEVKALGYGFTYRGNRSVEGGRKTVHDVDLRTAQGVSVLSAEMYATPAQGMMRKPDIRSFLLHDVYLSPVEGRVESLEDRLETRFALHQGETHSEGGVDYELRELRTQTPPPPEGAPAGTELTMARVAVRVEGGAVQIVEPALRHQPGGSPEVWGAHVPGTGQIVVLRAADPASGHAELGVHLAPVPLTKGQTVTVGRFPVKLIGFDVNLGEGGKVEMAAMTEVTVNGTTLPVRPTLVKSPQDHIFAPMEAPIGETGLCLVLDRVDANEGVAYLLVAPTAEEALVAEISLKPFILLLWVGTGLTLLGLTLATVNRGIGLSPARAAERPAPV